jgi:hypothetical protein
LAGAAGSGVFPGGRIGRARSTRHCTVSRIPARSGVKARWKAAFTARVNLIATNPYEDLAAVMR